MAKAKTKRQSGKRADNFVTDRLTAMVLCAFLGIFGAHKFYVGQKKLGIAFIVLDLTIIGLIVTMVWSFIDLIMMTVDKKNSKNEFIVGIVLLLFAGASGRYAGHKVVEKTTIIYEDGGNAAPKDPAKTAVKK